METKFKWYMVRCVTGKEQRAIENLEREFSRNGLNKWVEKVFFPKEKSYFFRNKDKVFREKPLFPGYFLVKINLSNPELERTIKNTDLVSQLMGDNKGPQSISQKEVDRIFNNIEKSKQDIKLSEGEEVKIINGPFKGFKATISSVNKKVLKVDVSIFGTITPLELNVEEVEQL
jgi:transcriptional antiterminator NusG